MRPEASLTASVGDLMGSMGELSGTMARLGVDVSARLLASGPCPVAAEAFSPRRWLGLGLLAARSGAAALGELPGAGIRFRELAEMVAAYEGFDRAGERVGPGPPTVVELPARLATVAALEPYLRLWTLEGLGHELADAAGLDDGRGLLAGDVLDAVPAGCHLPLHTGAGLAFATACLADTEVNDDPATLRRALARFVALARGASRRGYAGATLEALGLVVRTLHPQRLEEVGRHLAEQGAELAELFWHGVGRGLYFAPTNALLPAAGWRAASRALAEPPDLGGRRNAVAGLVWALTLVNLRRPEVLAAFLVAHGEELAAVGDDAIASGVGAAIRVWADAIGREAILDAWLCHRPMDLPADAWERWAHGPAIAALAGVDTAAPETLFRAPANPRGAADLVLGGLAA